MLTIFDYTDYRQYLRDYYTQSKERNPHFSHRSFLQKAGISSSGFFSNIISGKRNLSTRMVLRFAATLKLKKDEKEYFQNLVGYCQAKTVEERTFFYEKMLNRFKVEIRKLEADKFEFYSTWYYSAIREMLYYYPFHGTDHDEFETLGRLLNPAISAEEVHRAIDLLKRLGLIRPDATGRLRQSTPLLTSGSEFKSLHVAHFQRAMMQLATQAIDRFTVEQRDSSTLTMTLSVESFAKARQEIADLRKRLLALAQQDNDVDRVYQFNFQLFPLTKL